MSTAETRLARRVKIAKDLREAHAAADRVLAVARAAAKRAKEREPRTTGPTKEQRQAEHRASTTALRATVWARCGGSTITDAETGAVAFVGYGACEACGAELGVRWDMHHTEQGGARRSEQRAGSVLALCMECHRRSHRGDLGTLAQIARAPSLDAQARRAVELRIAKVERMRHPSVPLRVVVSGGER